MGLNISIIVLVILFDNASKSLLSGYNFDKLLELLEPLPFTAEVASPHPRVPSLAQALCGFSFIHSERRSRGGSEGPKQNGCFAPLPSLTIPLMPKGEGVDSRGRGGHTT